MEYRSCAALSLALAVLAGCSTLAPEGGFAPVAATVQERVGGVTRLLRTEEDAASARAFVNGRLMDPVTPDAAVEIALINNPALQARYADLGIAEAQLVQAGRVPNPRFSFSHLGSGGALEIERRFAVDVMSVLVMPLTLRLERGRFDMAQTVAAAEALKVAAEARRAAVSAIAAAETVRYHEQVLIAAEASAELARQMAAVGNWPKVSQMRQQVFHADAIAQIARARNAAALARERLVRVLGLAATPDAVKLPERLPDLPAQPREVPDVAATALAQRLDVRMARQGLDATVYALGLTRATRFVNVFDLAYKNKSDAGVPRRNGYEIEIEVPIFDWGDAKLAKAEAIYRQAASELAEASGTAQSEARAAYETYRTAYAVARHFRDEIVPLRKRIADENLLRYNGMLISVFELLADAREQVMSVNAAIEAQRDFWLAEADLQTALIGGAAPPGMALSPRAGDTAATPSVH